MPQRTCLQWVFVFLFLHLLVCIKKNKAGYEQQFIKKKKKKKTCLGDCNLTPEQSQCEVVLKEKTIANLLTSVLILLNELNIVE